MHIAAFLTIIITMSTCRDGFIL